MKKIFFLLTTIIFFLINNAQDTGIHFINAANWQQVLNKAKSENKYIFMDAYATWCGPCKYMSEKIFPLPEAGNYFNEHFINVKVQMDRTKSDPEPIKKWYTDARMLQDKYSVNAFPTYIVFSPEGKALHRVIGTTKTASDFIAKVQDAFTPSKQYYSAILEYKKHPKDSAFLRNAIKVALDNSDKINASAMGNLYIPLLKDPYSKQNLFLIREVTNSSKDKGFNMFSKHSAKVDAALGQGSSAAHLAGIMYKEELKSYFDNDKPADWPALRKKITAKYPMLTVQQLDFYQLHYYRIRRKIPEYDKAIIVFMNKYGESMNYYELNENAWQVFSNSENKEVLAQALKWSQRSLDSVPKTPGSDYVNYLDTYANLLYKLGNTDEAIKTERQLLDIARKDNKEKIVTICSQTLAKMEKGEKTWD